MNSLPIIVFPGLDGTNLLLDRFVGLASDSGSIFVLEIPDDASDDYESLADGFAKRIESFESCHVIAESFSGPLGILLAHRFPKIVQRLTLVASFATSPVPAIARILPWSILFRMTLPGIVARRYYTGGDQFLANRLRSVIRQASPRTLVRRMRCLMNVDVAHELTQLKCDIDYIRPNFDRLVPARSLTSILNANPSVVVHELDGPHLIMQTRPEQVWKCISK